MLFLGRLTNLASVILGSHISLPSPCAGPASILVIQYFRSYQSVGISSCLPLRCPFISFSVVLCSFSQKLSDFAQMWLCSRLLASSSGQTTLVFCFPGKFYVRLIPDVFISDVVPPGLPSCPSQHPHFG